IAGVLSSTTERRLFVKRVRRIGERRGAIRVRLRLMEMRMKHHLCSVPSGPANRFRIAPAFVADRDAESQVADVKDAAHCSGRVRALLAGVDLHLVLKPN